MFISKLDILGLSPLTCAWIKDFLTNRPKLSDLAPTCTLSIGSPQSCVLSPFLDCLYSHDCSLSHVRNLIGKFADDTTAVGLISRGDEATYRKEAGNLVLGE